MSDPDTLKAAAYTIQDLREKIRRREEKLFHMQDKIVKLRESMKELLVLANRSCHLHSCDLCNPSHAYECSCGRDAAISRATAILGPEGRSPSNQGAR